MTKFILLLVSITTFSFSLNPFNDMNMNNTKVVKNMESQKIFYAKRAANLGNAHAQFDLGLMYGRGIGVSKDERMAFNLFHKAARNNHTEAKFYMGLCFSKGLGVKKQAQLAKYWFKLAAKSGHSKAMAHLASLENSFIPRYGDHKRVAYNSFK